MTLQEFLNLHWPSRVDTTNSHVLLIQVEGSNHFYVQLETEEELKQGYDLAQRNEVVSLDMITGRVIYAEMCYQGKVYQRGVHGGVRENNIPWDAAYRAWYNQHEAGHVAFGWDADQVHNLTDLDDDL